MSSRAVCRSCGAPILWMTTAAGKSIPVEPSSISTEEAELLAELRGKLMFDPTRHRSHFARCPNAKKHRKEKKS